jgi:hypothetical protein
MSTITPLPPKSDRPGRYRRVLDKGALIAPAEVSKAAGHDRRHPHKEPLIFGGPILDKKLPVIFGDSTGVGFMQGAHCFQGNAQQGRPPAEVLAAIQAYLAKHGEHALQGCKAVLATGCANGKEADLKKNLQIVGEEIALLERAGVKTSDLVVLGCGDRRDYKDEDLNNKLSSTTAAAHVKFAGAFDGKPLKDEKPHKDEKLSKNHLIYAGEDLAPDGKNYKKAWNWGVHLDHAGNNELAQKVAGMLGITLPSAHTHHHPKKKLPRGSAPHLIKL